MIFYSALKAFVLLQDPLVYAYLKLNPFMQGDVAVLPFDDVLFVSAFVHCSRHVMENSLFLFRAALWHCYAFSSRYNWSLLCPLCIALCILMRCLKLDVDFLYYFPFCVNEVFLRN